MGGPVAAACVGGVWVKIPYLDEFDVYRLDVQQLRA